MPRLPNPSYMSYGNTAGQVKATTQANFGPIFFGQVVVTAADTVVDPTTGLLVCETNGAQVNVTLPTSQFLEGQAIYIKRVGANDVVVTPDAGTIDGAANATLSVDKEALLFIRNGAGLVFNSAFYIGAGYKEP